jgi:hypothetical protein
MADLDELHRLDAQIRYAEKRAVQRLAEHLRDAVRDLPSESRLALMFAQHARNLEACARENTPSLGADFELNELEQEFRDLDDEEEEK